MVEFTIGVGLHFLDDVTSPWGPKIKRKFLFH